jgi:hypothetical protein
MMPLFFVLSSLNVTEIIRYIIEIYLSAFRAKERII